MRDEHDARKTGCGTSRHMRTARFVSATTQVNRRMPPTIVVDNNIAAILPTRDDGLRRTIRPAIEKSHRD